VRSSPPLQTAARPEATRFREGARAIFGILTPRQKVFQNVSHGATLSLLGVFAAAALGLASFGVFGVWPTP